MFRLTFTGATRHSKHMNMAAMNWQILWHYWWHIICIWHSSHEYHQTWCGWFYMAPPMPMWYWYSNWTQKSSCLQLPKLLWKKILLKLTVSKMRLGSVPIDKYDWKASHAYRFIFTRRITFKLTQVICTFIFHRPDSFSNCMSHNILIPK